MGLNLKYLWSVRCSQELCGREWGCDGALCQNNLQGRLDSVGYTQSQLNAKSAYGDSSLHLSTHIGAYS